MPTKAVVLPRSVQMIPIVAKAFPGNGKRMSKTEKRYRYMRHIPEILMTVHVNRQSVFKTCHQFVTSRRCTARRDLAVACTLRSIRIKAVTRNPRTQIIMSSDCFSGGASTIVTSSPTIVKTTPTSCQIGSRFQSFCMEISSIHFCLIASIYIND